MSLSQQDRDEIKKIINDTVNGKIDLMNDKLDQYIDDTQGMVDFINGAKVTQKVVLWMTSIIIGVVGAFMAVKGLFR